MLISAGVAAGALSMGTGRVLAQTVKWSAGSEPPTLKAPVNACDCHHYIYDSRCPQQSDLVPHPADALPDDYRGWQRRIGTSRHVIVAPENYGLDNRVVLSALAAFGRGARATIATDGTISDGELRRLHDHGVRGIRFNLAPDAGFTTPHMIEPLSRRIDDLGWHVEINATAVRMMEICRVCSGSDPRLCSITSDISRSPKVLAIRCSPTSCG